MCVWRGNTLVSLCGLSSARHVPRLGEEPWCCCPSATKGWVCGQRTARAPGQPRCSPEKLSWQRRGRPDTRSPEGSGAAGTCLAGSPRPAGWADTSAGEGAPPAVLAWHPAESYGTKHEHSITGQLRGSRAPSPAAVGTCTDTVHMQTHTPAPAQGRDALHQPQSGGVELTGLHRAQDG